MAGLFTYRVFSITPALFSNCSWEPAGGEDPLCALIHTISHRGLERPTIGVSAGVLEPILSDAEGQLKL